MNIRYNSSWHASLQNIFIISTYYTQQQSQYSKVYQSQKSKQFHSYFVTSVTVELPWFPVKHVFPS